MPFSPGPTAGRGGPDHSYLRQRRSAEVGAATLRNAFFAIPAVVGVVWEADGDGVNGELNDGASFPFRVSGTTRAGGSTVDLVGNATCTGSRIEFDSSQSVPGKLWCATTDRTGSESAKVPQAPGCGSIPAGACPCDGWSSRPDGALIWRRMSLILTLMHIWRDIAADRREPVLVDWARRSFADARFEFVHVPGARR